MDKEYKVYSITNNINNKKYIGLTSQEINERIKKGKGYKPMTKIYKSIQKYGWNNFEVNILFTTKSKEDAEEKEKYFIKKFDTIENGYNKQSGGYKATAYKIEEETRIKLHNIHKGKHYSEKTEFKKNQINKAHNFVMRKVLCVETNKVYNSIIEAERSLNISHHVFDVCKGLRKTCGGYHWKYVKEASLCQGQ